MNQLSFGKAQVAQSVRRWCHDDSGEKSPGISALCQGTSERLVVKRGEERVRPDLSCHTWTPSALRCNNKAT